MYPIMMRRIVYDFYYKNKFSIRHIVTIFNISKSTIGRWVKHKHLINKRKVRKTYFAFFKNVISQLILSKSLLTLIQIKKHIFDNYSKHISISTIFRILKQLKITHKKVTVHHFHKNLPELNIQRNKFRNELSKIANKNIICLDETYFHPFMHKKYGRSLSGTRVVRNEKVNRSKKSLLMAITNKKVIAYQIYDTNLNAFRFHDFLKNKLLPKLKNKYILLDNVAFHKTNLIKEMIEKSSNKLLFIPPHSPDFNSIENVFSLVKNIYRSMNESSLSIDFKINSSIRRLNNYSFHNFYNHSKKSFLKNI
jgi:transposase